MEQALNRHGRLRQMLCATVIGLMALLAVACKKEDDTVVTVPARHYVDKTVAVVAPLSSDITRTRLERTAQWFQENLNAAQKSDTLAVRLTLEWHDEESEDLSALSTTLANRDDVLAIVGPFDSDDLATFAPACQKTRKPLIAPTATSEDVIRRYAIKNNGIGDKKPFLWSLTETDATMTETLMSAYATDCMYYNYAKNNLVFLYSPNNTYGQTFNYWAPFFAENYDIKLLENTQYDTDEQLVAAVRNTYNRAYDEQQWDTRAAFCIVEDIQQLYKVAAMRREEYIKKWNSTLFDLDNPAEDELWLLYVWDFDIFFALSDLTEEGMAALGERGIRTLRGCEGFMPYADPTTGFELSYEERFGVKPSFVECKFYDGMLLAAFAASYVEHFDKSLDVNDAIIDITAEQANTMELTVWNATSMETYLRSMEHGRMLNFKGASGKIAFDSETYTSATQTTYVHWRIMEGQILHTSYIGYGSSRRLTSGVSAWKYLYDKKQALDDFNKQAQTGTAVSYPALTAQYAVLVQGSEGFSNYRHLSDVLSVYQLLRKCGFPDDHIILIADRATANESNNVIRATVGGSDLMGGTDGLPAAVVDYDNASLTAADISNILTGTPTASTPTVLPRDAGQNVLLYWSGHGRNGEFAWRNTPQGKGFTSTMLQQTALTMLDATNPTCRKLFVVAEPCYGEGVISSLDGITGALGISGASSSEQSWADNWNDILLVWLSDRFTQNFVNCLSDAPTTTYRDLFLYCAEHTIGSHAKIVNAANFGNLTTTNPGEFIEYNK